MKLRTALVMALAAIQVHNSPLPVTSPNILEQVSLAVQRGTLAVTVIPAPRLVVLQASKDDPVVKPTSMSSWQRDDSQGTVFYFDLTDVPPGEFAVVVMAAPCDRRYYVFGKKRDSLRVG